MLAEYTSTSWGGTYTWSKSYIYAGSRLLFTATNNGAGGELKEYHHPDRLGTRMVTDPAANTLYLQSTLPFGTQFDSETTGSSNRLFTSYDRSTPTGLDYAVNRTYSAGQGRFTTVDPIGMASTSLGNPQSLNQFAYTQNSPTDFVDPSGLLLAAPNCRLLALEVFHSEVIEEAGGLVGLYACEADTGGGGAGYGIGHVVPPPDQPKKPEQDDPCSDVEGFDSGIAGHSASELDDAALTVFGEISAKLHPDLNKEALAVASVIFNRSDAVRDGTQGNNPFGKTPSLSDVVKAGSQFAGFNQGLELVKRGATRENEFREGQRNCTRLQVAREAVKLATDPNNRNPFLFFVSNFGGKRTVGPGQVRIGGNDFSTNPISIK